MWDRKEEEMEKSKRASIIVVGILLVGLFIGVAYKEGVRKGMERAAAPTAPAIAPAAVPVAMPVAPAAGVASIGSITQAGVGQRATLKGNIVSVYVFKGEKGRSVKISDGTGTIDILIWSNLYYQIPQKDSLVPGTSVQVSGEIGSYKGRLQIKPRSPSDVQIAGAAAAVPTVAPAVPVAPAAPVAVPVPVTTGTININTASQSELESLPGIGPAKALLIIAGRPYATVDDLVKVKGIGPATLEKLRPGITVK